MSGHASRIGSSTRSSSQQTRSLRLAIRIQFGLQPLEIDCATDDSGNPLPKAIATAYYNAGLTGEQLIVLVGAKSAKRLHLLNMDLEDEPLDLAAPDDIDVYGGA